MNTPKDPRPLLYRAAGQFAALVATVEPGQLDTPTPCHEFDIRALIAHVLGNTLAYPHIMQGTYRAAEPGNVAEVPGDDWAAAYADAEERLIVAGWAMDDRALDRMVDLGFATLPAPALPADLR
ncbi:maleylpyruvate isomerase N-terminal domain-containing protein [Streptomyces sp. NPDC015345]|uniref:maleylpyruvate isomerase N-terminal domain-containing protein n=2 Tax=unclassified Streptomyces TaxID=2593676 RepID=UPI0036FF0C5F